MDPMKRLYFLLCFLVAAACNRSTPADQLVAIQIQDRNGLTETITAPDRVENYRQLDFLASQPYKKIIRVFKSNGKTRSKISTYHPNGAIWQYLEAEEQRAHGAYKEWYPNGQQRIDAHVIGGTADVAQGSQHDWLFDGISQVWDEQGRLLAKIPYRQGRLEGTSVYFYPSGQVEKELPYRQHLFEGAAIEYHPNGRLRSKTNYRQGVKQGLSLGYFESGQEAWIEEYTDDLILKAVYYDPMGRTISEIEDGSGFRSIFENGFLSLLVQIRQGSPEGGVKQYTPKGDLLGIYHIKNGKKHGEEISYFLPNERLEAGKEPLPKLSLNWDRGQIHGSVKTWYSSGQIQSQREYSRNKRSGTSLSWYRDGSLMLIEEYEEDRLLKGQYYKKSGRDPVSSIVNGSGIATLYDEDGIFLHKVTYAKGEPVDPEN
jgi:antitoxin component YwqK of YwqJK toxin-antitoxin module